MGRAFSQFLQQRGISSEISRNVSISKFSQSRLGVALHVVGLSVERGGTLVFLFFSGGHLPRPSEGHGERREKGMGSFARISTRTPSATSRRAIARQAVLAINFDIHRVSILNRGEIIRGTFAVFPWNFDYYFSWDSVSEATAGGGKPTA